MNLVKNFLKKIIKEKHSRIYCFIRLLKYSRNKEFITEINLINQNPNVLKFKSLGNENLGKNIFFIKLFGKKRGLGGFLHHTLLALYESDKLGFIPYVYYDENNPYKEKSILTTNNTYEYYFKQKENLTIDKVNKSNRVFYFNDAFLERIELELCKENTDMKAGYYINEDYLKALGKIAKNYLVLNENVIEYIQESINDKLENKIYNNAVLAVHARGTDYALNWKNHPNMVSVEDFFIEIDKALEQYNFEYIFLATDDSNRLEAFKNKYKEKLMYFSDVHRSSGKVNVALEKNNRENNAYLNGLEVIRDIYTLAQCQGLIAGLSQVSTMARIVNYTLDKRYIYKKIIDKGIYKK